MNCVLFSLAMVSSFLVATFAQDQPEALALSPAVQSEAETQLNGLSATSRDELTQILSNEALTKQQQQDSVAEWAKKQGGEIQKMMTVEMDQMKSVMEKMNEQIDASDLSEAAKTATHQIEEVLSNMQITPQENAEKFQEILKALPEGEEQKVEDFFTKAIGSMPMAMPV